MPSAVQQSAGPSSHSSVASLLYHKINSKYYIYNNITLAIPHHFVDASAHMTLESTADAVPPGVGNKLELQLGVDIAAAVAASVAAAVVAVVVVAVVVVVVVAVAVVVAVVVVVAAAAVYAQ